MPSHLKKSGLFSRIESREEAFKIIKDVSNGFFLIAAIQGLVGAFLIRSLLLDAALYAVLAAMLRAWRSRMVALLLLGSAFVSAVCTVLTKLGVAQLGGNNVLLAAIMLWVAFRGVQATFLLWGRLAEPAPLAVAPPPLPNNAPEES